MNEAEILARMKPILEDVLDISIQELKPEETAADYEGWDSLAHITIIACMEKEFSTSFTLSEVKSLENIKGFVELVKSKIS